MRVFSRLPVLTGAGLLLAAGVWAGRDFAPGAVSRLASAATGTGGAQTVAGALRQYGPAARRRFEPVCRQQGIVWPPRCVTLVVLKQERRLEVWGANAARGPYRHLADYPVLAASGLIGPKRREGDRQVPEGFYRLSALNPNSAFHLSLRVDYPSADDARLSRLPPGARMGGDIYVHGGAASIGCVAIGDPAIEEVFCLAALAPAGARRIIISPIDFRRPQAPAPADLAVRVAQNERERAWLAERYVRLRAALRGGLHKRGSRVAN